MLNFSSNESKQLGSTDQLTELEAILGRIDGVGQVKVYIHQDNVKQETSVFQSYFQNEASENSVFGILVVAEGATDDGVKRSLINTLSRVLQVPTHRIVIVPMVVKEENG